MRMHTSDMHQMIHCKNPIAGGNKQLPGGIVFTRWTETWLRFGKSELVWTADMVQNIMK